MRKIKKHKSNINIKSIRKIKEKSSILKQRLGEFLELPYELIGNSVKITLIDNKYVYVEGNSSVEDYTPEHIRLKLHNTKVVIEGRELTIKELGKTEIIIEGIVKGAKYEN